MRYYVEYYTDWADYPEWENSVDYDNKEKPFAFDTEAQAQAHIDRVVEESFSAADRAYTHNFANYLQSMELYNKRRKVLEKKGLWKQPGEPFPPLIGYCSPGVAPSRKQFAENYRITLKEDDEYA